MKKLLFLLIFLSSCIATAPPNLTPAGVSAFNKTRVIKSIDVIRDTAQDAASAHPPVIPIATAIVVTKWHRSALIIINTDANWKNLILTSLDEVLNNLSPSEKELLTPYVILTKTILTEISR